MKPIRSIPVAEFLESLKAQGVPGIHLAFICPMCQCVQSMDSLIKAGAGATETDVERYVGFSCVGRWTGADGPRKKPDGKPCDWTLGGLFSLHQLEVVTEDGKTHRHFEVASPEQAKTLMEGGR